MKNSEAKTKSSVNFWNNIWITFERGREIRESMYKSYQLLRPLVIFAGTIGIVSTFAFSRKKMPVTKSTIVNIRFINTFAHIFAFDNGLHNAISSEIRICCRLFEILEILTGRFVARKTIEMRQRKQNKNKNLKFVAIQKSMCRDGCFRQSVNWFPFTFRRTFMSIEGVANNSNDSQSKITWTFCWSKNQIVFFLSKAPPKASDRTDGDSLLRSQKLISKKFN